MAAALLMSSTRSILRLIAVDGRPPGAVLQQLNRILLADFPTGRFVTMVYAVIDPGVRSMSLAVAGHPPPLWVGPEGASFLEAGAGLPSGIHDGQFSEIDVHLDPGDRLVLYSDGVTEATRDHEEYGPERLRARCIQGPATVSAIVDDVRTFTGSDALLDDVTVVTMEGARAPLQE